MFPINQLTLDKWLADYEAFNYDFRRFCFMNFKVHGLQADFVPNVTKQIHAQWAEDVAKWLAEETDDKTEVLSHIKILALLLHSLNQEPFLGQFYDHEYQEEPEYTFVGTDAQKAQARLDLVDGRGALLAMDFCVMMVDWYERNRTDRSEPFKQPMTRDMRHDLLNYLVGDNVDQKALYLILKAIYLRHGSGSAN